MSRIILFGGTFDPIHNGHIALCQAALDFADADQVILIPTIPPYKQNAKIASGEDRLFMCQLATRGMDPFSVDSSEIERGTPAYTADTVKRLARKYPEDDLYYLLGSDAFMAFHYWVRWKDVAENATLLVGLRGDENREEMLYERDRLTREGVRVILMGNSPVVISATEIRKKIRSKETLKYLHPDVAKYIQLRDLYYDSQEDDTSTLDAITDKVRRAPVHAHEH
ncbi:MAG: nicotinate (nicotinamide) nucleotide adenylyltransferase, partial [Eubacteriales bacterium]|nr:nicotinate (nicotinamide) nucleotide adenylyltransferase [Eubacteriales bacterium]